MKSTRSITIWIISAIAIAFGLLTIKSGGAVLFVDGAGRQAAGNYVPFVLGFNFVMGFVYVIAGIGLWLQKSWAVWLSMFIALATLVIFAAFGIHILQGGLFEQRTIGAMVLRSILWSVISVSTYRKYVMGP